MYFKLHNWEDCANLERCCCANCLTNCLVTDSTNVQQKKDGKKGESRLGHFKTEWDNYVLCRHTRKQQFSDKTVLVIASQMGQFFRRPQTLNVQCHYQLVASTSCQFTADAHSTPVRLVRRYVRSWTSLKKSGYVKLLIAVGTEI